jgi:hypothetical protein
LATQTTINFSLIKHIQTRLLNNLEIKKEVLGKLSLNDKNESRTEQCCNGLTGEALLLQLVLYHVIMINGDETDA